MGNMIWAILAPFRKALAWAAGIAVLIGGAFLAGRRDAKQARKVQDLKAEVKAHERINEADLGIGASDADNQRWLREFHERNSR